MTNDDIKDAVNEVLDERDREAWRAEYDCVISEGRIATWASVALVAVVGGYLLYTAGNRTPVPEEPTCPVSIAGQEYSTSLESFCEGEGVPVGNAVLDPNAPRYLGIPEGDFILRVNILPHINDNFYGELEGHLVTYEDGELVDVKKPGE